VLWILVTLVRQHLVYAADPSHVGEAAQTDDNMPRTVKAICSFTAKLLRSYFLYGHFVTTWTPVRVSRGATLSEKLGSETRNSKHTITNPALLFDIIPPPPFTPHVTMVRHVPDAICKVCRLRANSGMHRATFSSSLFAKWRPLQLSVMSCCSYRATAGLRTVMSCCSYRATTGLRTVMSCCSYRATTGLRTVMSCCSYCATAGLRTNVMLQLPRYRWSEDCNVMLQLPSTTGLRTVMSCCCYRATAGLRTVMSCCSYCATAGLGTLMSCCSYCANAGMRTVMSC